ARRGHFMHGVGTLGSCRAIAHNVQRHRWANAGDQVDLARIAELYFGSRGSGRLSKRANASAGICETPGRNFDAELFQRLEYSICLLRAHTIFREGAYISVAI